MRSKPIEVRLAPVDNLRLARLCGALDENLRQIESALDVTIARRGAKFTVAGPAGTGNTHLAVACGVDAPGPDKGTQTVRVRPAVEAAERPGFRPGNLAQ